MFSNACPTWDWTFCYNTFMLSLVISPKGKTSLELHFPFSHLIIQSMVSQATLAGYFQQQQRVFFPSFSHLHSVYSPCFLCGNSRKFRYLLVRLWKWVEKFLSSTGLAGHIYRYGLHGGGRKLGELVKKGPSEMKRDRKWVIQMEVERWKWWDNGVLET